MAEATVEPKREKLPDTLHYGMGLKIDIEDLVAKAALLNEIVGGFLNDASHFKVREPISYPLARSLQDLSSTIYNALAQNVYTEEDIGDKENFI